MPADTLRLPRRLVIGLVALSIPACGDDGTKAAETGSSGSVGMVTITGEPGSSSAIADSTLDDTSATTAVADASTSTGPDASSSGGREASVSSDSMADTDASTSGSSSSDSSSGSSSEGGSDTGGDPGAGLLDFETAHVHSTLVSSGNDSFAVADFDDDGAPDVALTDSSDDTVNVLLNDGAGGFGAPIENAAPGVGRIAAGDVDGDGLPDVVVLDGAQLHVLSGLGDGTLSAPLTTELSLTYAPHLVDLDGDGDLDLVGRQLGGPHVLLGDGTGVFTLDASYTLGSTQALAVLDVDGDGADDLAAYADSAVLVRLGDGTGVFGATMNNALTALGGVAIGGLLEQAIAIGDIDGDGYGDLATDDSNGVTILLGEADGSLHETVRFPGRFKAVADFDGDGVLDLLIEAINQSGRTMLRSGLGDGTFDVPQAYTLGNYPVGIGRPTDVDLDGATDVVFARFATTLFGDGDGTPRLPRVTLQTSNPYEIAGGEFDGGPHPDVVVASEDASSIATLLGQPDGRFTLGQEVTLPFAPESLAVGDVDEDGHDDVYWGRPQGQGGTMLGDGAGGLQPGVSVPAGLPVLLVDLNGDQHLDALASFGAELRACLGDGAGSFAPMITSANDGNLTSMVAFHADGDAHVDIATASWDASTISVLLGDGAGTFATSHTIPLVNVGLAVDHGDFDGDGDEDLAYVVNTNPVGVGIALGLGDGTYGPPSMMGPNVGSIVSELAVEDFDGDGALDVAVRTVPSYVDILVGAGDGTFAQGRRQPMQGVRQFIAQDQDLDGRIDIVACHSVGSPPGFVSTMRNATQ